MNASADALMGIFGFKRVEDAMKTIEETRRELFEAWAATKWPHIGRHRRDALPVDHERHSEYVMLQSEWLAFNAALDAVCIVMPESELDESRAVAIEDCRAAIESTSLGIKVK